MSSILEPLAEPEEYELQFCLSLEYGLVIEHASDKLSLLMIDCIKRIKSVSAWYVGSDPLHPETMLSSVLNPQDNKACSRFNRFIKTVKRYEVGKVPNGCFAKTIRVARSFCKQVETVLHDVAAVNLRDNINALYLFLSDDASAELDRASYDSELDQHAENVRASLNKVRDAFYKFEQAKLNPPTTPPAADAKLDNINKTLNRMDARDRNAKSDQRRVYTIVQQETSQSYWERAQGNQTLKDAAVRRVTKRQAFEYYRSELRLIGIETYEAFVACLGARSDRLCRERTRARERAVRGSM